MNEKTVGGRIRQLRQNAGITQVQLAQLLGCSQSAISYMETEPTAQPTAAELLQLCEILRTTPNEIYGWSP